ncbi:MAG: hypothetical protein ACE5R3_06535 [Nitrosopumilaceae archaeon]
MKIIIALVLFSVVFLVGIDQSENVFAQSQNKLSVSFENDVAPSYEVSLNPNEKYILSQSYSWIRDQTSRYNLVAYTIDGSDHIPIPRIARGEFTLDISTDSSHSVVFFAVPQFPIEVTGAEVFFFTPESPTQDNWFDLDSKVSVVVPKGSESEGGKVRKAITGWSIDKTKMQAIIDDDSEFFNTPTIQMSNFHTVDFTTQTQYKLEVLSQFGTTTGTGWYSKGTEVTVSVVPPGDILVRNVVDHWEGPGVESHGNSATLVINEPTTVQAIWSTDYSLLIVVMIVPAAVGFFFFRRRKQMIVSAPQVAQVAQVAPQVTRPSVGKPQSEKQYVAQRFDFKYSSELTKLTKNKTVEKLEKMCEAKLMTESRLAEIKKKLE